MSIKWDIQIMEYYSKVICNSKTKPHTCARTKDNLETMNWLSVGRLKVERMIGGVAIEVE